MQGIIPEKHQRKVFDILIQAPLDLVMKEGEVHKVSQNLQKMTPGAVFYRLSI